MPNISAAFVALAMRTSKIFGSPPEMETKNTAGEVDHLIRCSTAIRVSSCASWGGKHHGVRVVENENGISRRNLITPCRAFASIASGIRTVVAVGFRRTFPGHYNEAYRWDNVWDYESYDNRQAQS